MPRHVLIPGTFDPPTTGHQDLFERAARLFPRVTIAVADHPTKQAILPADERVALLEECAAGLAGVEVVRFAGLVVDACRELGCDAIVRGIRSGADFDYEAQMASTNRALFPSIDTILLATSPTVAHVSSTLVRQIASLGGDVRGLVPSAVAGALRRRFPKPTTGAR